MQGGLKECETKRERKGCRVENMKDADKRRLAGVIVEFLVMPYSTNQFFILCNWAQYIQNYCQDIQ